MAKHIGAKQHDGVKKKSNQGDSKYSKWTTKVRQKQKASRGQG